MINQEEQSSFTMSKQPQQQQEAKKGESTMATFDLSDGKHSTASSDTESTKTSTVNLRDIVDQLEKSFGLEIELELSPVHKRFCKDFIGKKRFPCILHTPLLLVFTTCSCQAKSLGTF